MNGITKTSLIPASKTKSGSLLCFNRKMREEFPWDYASLRVIVPRIVSYHRDSFVSGAIEASETPLLLFLSRYLRFFLYSRNGWSRL